MARYALGAGYHVVIEGILYADHYGEMLTRLVGDHRGVTRCYYLDMYRERDLLPGGIKTVIGSNSALRDTVDRIMRETALSELPPRDT
ncbi:P-loop NTPase family protein [Streptomyces kaniharaensis]|uniref:hypothetical protein n=1 Tax=Streptomyces kaniharaensis TaxID=212423 RepID=UPI00389A0B58